MRIDTYLVTKNYFDSRTKAKQAIERKEVILDGKLIDKPSLEVSDIEHKVEIIREKSFVSLGGYKLDKALCDLSINVSGLVAADVGSSTGGFTDCLIQHDIKKVYCVDLNDELLHHSLKRDSRISMIVKNARDLVRSDFLENLDLIVADLSFISATLVLETFSNLLDNDKQVILLIKPQFENEEKKKFKNGIIKDKKIQEDACKKVIDFAKSCNFNVLGLTTAPINNQKNLEFLLHLQKI